jgi:hypothetical protein
MLHRRRHKIVRAVAEDVRGSDVSGGLKQASIWLQGVSPCFLRGVGASARHGVAGDIGCLSGANGDVTAAGRRRITSRRGMRR